MITVSDRRTQDAREDRAVALWTRLRRRQLETARRGRILASARYASLAQRTGLGLWGRGTTR